jgi:hypothetical protein
MFTSLVSLLPQGIERIYSNGYSLSLTSQPAANSGGGLVICGVDINSPFVHASKMSLPPVLQADEPFANEKNIDKAKEWVRKEGWRKRVWWVRRRLESMRRLKEHFKKVFRKRCASKIVYIAIVIRKDLHERFFKNIGANKGSPEKPAYSRSSKSPVKVCALWFAPAVPLCLRSPTISSCLPLKPFVCFPYAATLNALRRKQTGKARTGENKQVRKQIGKTNRWKLKVIPSILHWEVIFYVVVRKGNT